jgi:hypothetical protein
MLYTFLSPTHYVMSSDTVNEAIKNYVKMNQRYRINELIVKDHQQHYKAHMKYFQKDGRNKAGISIYGIPRPTTPSINIDIQKGQNNNDITVQIERDTHRTNQHNIIIPSRNSLGPIMSPVSPMMSPVSPMMSPMSPMMSPMSPMMSPMSPMMSPMSSMMSR